MPGREEGRSRISGKKRLGRWCIKLWLTSPLTKWQINADGHESSTETDFFSSHQRFGIPYCMGSHHTWDRCTSPNPCKTTSVGGEIRGCHKRKVVRQSSHNLPVKLPWGQKTGSCSFSHGCLPRASTEDGWRPQVMWFGCRLQKEHVHKAEGTISIPIDAGGIVNPKENVTDHGTGSW